VTGETTSVKKGAREREREKEAEEEENRLKRLHYIINATKKKRNKIQVRRNKREKRRMTPLSPNPKTKQKNNMRLNSLAN